MCVAPSTTAPHGPSTLQLLLHRTLSVSHMLHLCTVYIALDLYTDTTYTCVLLHGPEADKCGMRGVMRVAHIDMRNTSVNCPAPLTQYQLGLEESNASTKTAELCDLPYPSLHLLITFHSTHLFPTYSTWVWEICSGLFSCACSSLLLFSCLHKTYCSGNGSVNEKAN